MDFCQRYARVAWSHQPGNVCLFTRLRCKQWSCPYCAKANQKMWRAFLGGQLPIVSDEWWHVTLTAHSRMRSEQASYKNLQVGIDRIIKRIRRVFGKVEYVRVFEPHPTSQALHAHLLISNLTPFVVPGCHKNLQPGFLAVTHRDSYTGAWSVRTWLKKAAQGVQIGYQCDVKRCESGFAVFYITKYLTKAQGNISVKGLRHVSTSRRVGSPSMESEHRWEVGNFITSLDMGRDEVLLDIQVGISLPYMDVASFGLYPPETERLTNGL